MGLKVVLDTLDGLDEATQSFYAEKEGAYVLDLEGVDNHPDVANLRNAYQAEKAKRQEQGKKLETTQARLAELEAKPNPTKADDAEILKLREALEGERDQWKTKATELEGTVYKLTVENQLDAALRDAGVADPGLAMGAKALLQGKIKVADGKPVAETDMGPIALSEYVKRWASSDGAAYVSKPSGGGAGGSKGGGAGAQKRSGMSAAEKAAYLAEHGQAAYLKLPR